MARYRTRGRGGFITAGLGFGVAAGVALGALVIAPNLPYEAGASGATDQEEQEADVSPTEEFAVAQLGAANDMVSQLAPGVSEGTLADRPVLQLRTTDAETSGLDATRDLMTGAGAIDAGTIVLNPKFFSPAGADELKSIAASTLPAGAELSTESLSSGTHAGQLLAAALLLDPETGEPMASTEDRALVLQSLRDAEFIDYPDGTVLPAQAIMLATGTGSDDLVVDNQVDFATALQDSGAVTVATGTIEAAADEAFLGRLRAADTAVSTVDSIGQPWAQFSVLLATVEQISGGESGDYGAAAAVDAPTPPLP